MKNTGLFFAFEGIDGCGKSTQIKLLKDKMEAAGHKCMMTREPTDGPVGSLIHQCMTGRMVADERTISALFAADRLDHILNEKDGILSLINNGISVISDRYVLSNYAYQSVEVSSVWLEQLNSQVTNILKPDAHIFLDISPEESLKRITSGRFHTEKYETLERLREVRERYLNLIYDMSDRENIIVIDAVGDVDEISDNIWTLLSDITVSGGGVK